MAFLGLETLAQKGIFVLYMGFSLGFGLLNQRVKSAGIAFNGATAVLLQILLKIFLSCVLYVRNDGTFLDLLSKAIAHRRVFFLYAVPASLYAAYDVLWYVNLRRLDLTTCYLLMNARLVVSGLIRRVVFKRGLRRRQWIALVVIAEGCAVKVLGDNASAAAAVGDRVSLASLGLVLVQVLAGQAAGAYNELLLKERSDVPLHLQNLFLYLNSIPPLLLAMASGIAGQSPGEALRPENLRTLRHPAVLSMVAIASATGLVTGAFLQRLDAVRKAIANALEMVTLPLASAALFGRRITPRLACAAAMVSAGIYLYSVPAGAGGRADKRGGDDGGDDGAEDVERPSPEEDPNSSRTIEPSVRSRKQPGATAE